MFIFLMFSFLMLHSCSRQDDKDTIQLGIGTGLPTPTSAVGPPHDLLGYQIPETVQFPFNHLVLRWNIFGRPLMFPLFKVQDFPNMERE